MIPTIARMCIHILSLGLFCTTALVLVAVPAGAVTQGWVQAHKVKLRLHAGGAADQNTEKRLAFLEFDLEPGWKTYWRHPGDGGGIPPEFTWTGSNNLQTADVLFPQPRRLKDEIGDTVGYTGNVVFPIVLTPEDARAPIQARLSVRFGICKDICVPLDANLQTDVVAGQTLALPLHVSGARDRVPRSAASRKSSDPQLAVISPAVRKGEGWAVRFETRHEAGARAPDLFLEAPGGVYVPVPKPTSPLANGRAAYEITLRADEFSDLRGQTLRATVVDSQGSSERTIQLTTK